MNAAQVHQIIFRPGFSTRAEITEISGRGVGLDVVRNQIQALQGHVEVQSVPGPGERPQTFETVEEIDARPEWNAVRPWLSEPRVAGFGATSSRSDGRRRSPRGNKI